MSNDATTAIAGATLTTSDKTLELPLVKSTEGNDGYSIATLLKDTGNVTLDNGFTNTASCKSEITYIDGDAGILRYRGYPIEQLAKKSSFVEVSYLLIYGELPTQAQLEDFTERISRHTMLHEDLKAFFSGFPRDAHPMPVLSSAVSALSTFYQDSLDPFDQEQVEISTIRLLAKLPTIAAYAHKKSIGQPFLYPDNSLSLVENFLRMTFGNPAEAYELDPDLVKALDLLLVLHADHEQNCSTSTVRLVGSSHANMFASVSAGINALFGPLHGGANQAVLEMLEKIQNADYDVDTFMKKVKDKDDGVRLMGFGHRVYKNYDPRAAIIKETAHELLDKQGHNNELLEIALRLEDIALHDDYFVSRKLYPNVDFYTGLIYKAMGFPTKMFTVLFALGRVPGWIAQWREMIEDPETKIGRPRQIYIGEPARDFVDVWNRK
ncbi:citrate synthase [Kribbia dieselivorans]|uniref:citrate synthase n=1 Tax=Kribbia dieselivorans TaxID=331526 RepID=UPI0009F98001|nr:citrate synthase [Kribbia dieselivorans]